eukprot:TCONS_00035781-protein
MDDSQVIQCEIDKNDLFGLEGYERIPISFQRGSYFDTVEYQFVPEIYTYYIMDKRKLTYKQATSFMCGKHQPTAYHVSKLNQLPLKRFSVKEQMGLSSEQIAK